MAFWGPSGESELSRAMVISLDSPEAARRGRFDAPDGGGLGLDISALRVRRLLRAGIFRKATYKNRSMVKMKIIAANDGDKRKIVKTQCCTAQIRV